MRKLDPVFNNCRLSWIQVARQSTGSAKKSTSAYTQQVRPNASVLSIYVPANLMMRILGRYDVDLSRPHSLTTKYHRDLFCIEYTVEHSR